MKASALATIAAVAVATELPKGDFEFMRYVAKFNKSYQTVEEYQHRLNQYLKIDEYIKKVNAPGSGYTHTAAHNRFSDYTPEEFSKMMTLRNVSDHMPQNAQPFTAKQNLKANSNCDLNGCDYRSGSCVTPVKD